MGAIANARAGEDGRAPGPSLHLQRLEAGGRLVRVPQLQQQPLAELWADELQPDGHAGGNTAGQNQRGQARQFHVHWGRGGREEGEEGERGEAS